jgi:peptidoglycan/LPS O-acetylase OafA/YrhL
MKKTVLIFVICALVLMLVMVWVFKSKMAGGLPEILRVATIFIIVGFAVLFGIRRAGSLARKEPLEDELSKKVMMKTASLSYYISLYLWLFIMYMSDKTTMETHTLIGTGIIGMAIIFFLSWLYAKFFGLKNG